MEHTGYILLAEISGYTELFTKTEIDHGGQILHSLLGIVVGETKLPLNILEIEGDAVFSYAPSEAVDRGGLLPEMVENIYMAFSYAREDSRRSTTCECGACRRISDLDMNFIVHRGAYTTRAVGPHPGIAGPDVILAHRLLKNCIIERTGCAAYAYYTQQAADALHIEEMTAQMVPHDESYEHFGTVHGYVEDLGEYFAKGSAKRDLRIRPEDAWLVLSDSVPVSRAVAWEYFSNAKLARHWMSAGSLTSTHLLGGRRGPGTVSRCVHGKKEVFVKTLAWKPLQFATLGMALPFNVLLPISPTFEDDGDGTRVTWTVGSLIHDRALVRALCSIVFLLQKGALTRAIKKQIDTYFSMLRKHATSAPQYIDGSRAERSKCCRE